MVPNHITQGTALVQPSNFTTLNMNEEVVEQYTLTRESLDRETVPTLPGGYYLDTPCTDIFHV